MGGESKEVRLSVCGTNTPAHVVFIPAVGLGRFEEEKMGWIKDGRFFFLSSKPENFVGKKGSLIADGVS